MSEAFNLEGLFSLSADEYVDAAEDAATATDDMGEAGAGAADGLLDLEPAGIAAGGALAGAATAAQSVLDSTQSLREELGRTSVSIGMTQEETRDLATDLSNATFPIEDVSGTLDVLAQAGVEGEESLTETANAADLIADATGNSATEIADNAVPALRAMGEDAEDLNEHMDTFTYVARNTTMSVDDFSRVVTKTGPEIQELGLGVDDTAAIMAALEERGLDSRTAMREFRQAANDAEGDTDALMESLGLSADELDTQRDALRDAEGATQDHAAAANDSLTVMDDLRAGFADAKLQAAEYLGPVEGAIPAMQGFGTAAIALSTTNMSAVVPSLTAVTASLAPLLPILLPLGAAIGAVGYAWSQGWIDPAETAAWAAEKVGGAIGWVTDKVMRFYPPIRLAREVWENNLFGIQDTTEAALSAVGDLIDWVIEKINAIPGVDIPTDDIEDAADAADTDEEVDVSGPASDWGSPQGGPPAMGSPDATAGVSGDGTQPPQPTPAPGDTTGRGDEPTGGGGGGPVRVVIEMAEDAAEFVDARIEENERDQQIDVYTRGG